jgi:hypothetical protein
MAMTHNDGTGGLEVGQFECETIMDEILANREARRL